jgi:hypothetical protein
MDTLDLGCIKEPYSSRGKVLKGSTPLGEMGKGGNGKISKWENVKRWECQKVKMTKGKNVKK